MHVRIWMQLFSVPFSGWQWYPFPKKPGLHVETKGMIATVFILIMRYHPNKVLDLYLHMHWNLPDFPSKLHTAFSWQISPPSRRQSRPPSARWHSVPGPWKPGRHLHTKPWVRARASRQYWEKLRPAAGRPFCASMSCPDNWGVTQGHDILKQQREATTKADIEKLQVSSCLGTTGNSQHLIYFRNVRLLRKETLRWGGEEAERTNNYKIIL